MLLLLQLFVAWISAVSGGEGWKHVPEIPAGRRAQYLLLKANGGGYSYGYDTGTGISAQQSASSGNEVAGDYRFLDATGNAQAVRYTAGVGGFVPDLTGTSSIKGFSSSGASSGISGASSYSAGAHQNCAQPGHSHNVVDSYGNAAHSQHNTAYNTAVGTNFNYNGQYTPLSNAQNNLQETLSPDYHAAGTPMNDLQQEIVPYIPTDEDEESSGSGDSSYSFSYTTDDHSRSESSDAQGNVQGTYTYFAPTGTQERVDYEASDKTGFVVKQTSSQPSNPNLPAAVGHSTGTGFLATGSRLPGVVHSAAHSGTLGGSTSFDSQQTPSSGTPDASYSFSYDAGSHSRSESSDASGNVKGTYSFVTHDDGQTRKVDYSAGPETGFIAVGNHLPVPQSPSTNPSTSINAGPPPGSSDGSYSFSYDAGDHSRSETVDSSGNVRGSFSFVAKDDGQNRNVNYAAGSATGFVAVGNHLPVPPPLQSSPPQIQPIIPPPAFTKTVSPTGPHGGPPPDGSYSFSYDAGDHSRSETGDSSGNVKGSFSFVAKDDGQTRRLDYSSGSSTGFVAAGSHLPVPVSPQVSGQTYTSVPGHPQGPGQTYTSVPGHPQGPGQTYTSVPGHPQGPGQTYAPIPNLHSANDDQVNNGDASYSYSYETDSSHKQETSDASGNVQGSFTYVGGDGVPRTVQYTAKDNEGFIAVGDHLPKQNQDSSTGFTVKGNASPQQPQVPYFPNQPPSNNRFDVKGGVKGHSFTQQRKGASSGSYKTTGYLLNTYLSPNSEKFGYIYDTKNN